MASDLAWQPALWDGTGTGADGSARTDAGVVRLDPDFARLRRRVLPPDAWLDVQPGWCTGADGLLARLLAEVPWVHPRRVRMYDRTVVEPRLTHRWERDSGPQPPPELVAMADLLGERYGVRFTQVGVNLYRHGADSVAWHGDRVARELPAAVVALVPLGAVRPFRLRPTGGGPGIGLLPGPGDLLVMGGSCQRTWQHAVPKVAAAAPRISIQFRHAYPGSPNRVPGDRARAGRAQRPGSP